MGIDIEFRVPSGNLPEGSDPIGFEKAVQDELRAVSERYRISFEGPRKAPPPAGATGIHEILQWAVDNKDEIEVALKALNGLVIALGNAARFYLKLRKDASKPDPKGAKDGKARLAVRVKNHELELPADSKKEIDDFLKKLR